MEHSSASVSFQDYHEMIKQAKSRLPQEKAVVLLADRGKVHTELLGMLTSQLGWNYRIRLKSDSWIWRAGQGWCQLNNFHFKWGEALCLHNVYLHKREAIGPLHLDGVVKLY